MPTANSQRINLIWGL